MSSCISRLDQNPKALGLEDQAAELCQREESTLWVLYGSLLPAEMNTSLLRSRSRFSSAVVLAALLPRMEAWCDEIMLQRVPRKHTKMPAPVRHGARLSPPSFIPTPHSFWRFSPIFFAFCTFFLIIKPHLQHAPENPPTITWNIRLLR